MPPNPDLGPAQIAGPLEVKLDTSIPAPACAVAEPNPPKSTALPFDPEVVARCLGPSWQEDWSFCEVEEGSKVYGLLAAHVATAAASAAQSVVIEVGAESDKLTTRASVLASMKRDKAAATARTGLGLGLFEFEFEGGRLCCLHHRVGAPVGTNCGPKIWRSLVIFVEGSGRAGPVVTRLANELLAAEGERSSEAFTVFRWHVKYQYWKKDVTVLSRPLDSVVLNTETKDAVVTDLDDFLDDATCEFYLDHGIPYKRSYLFHGAPGAGKTSLIQALAGKYGRNIAYLQPSHPEMTDDALKEAVRQTPARSIIVLEDVDALFASDRKSQRGSHLTFSGLLNALDGVGPPLGQIFILTTNHRERLDPALIRNGRVDLHVHFTAASARQMEQMFAAFYPASAPELAAEFASRLRAELGVDGTVSMAGLQHYFIRHRKSPAAVAASEVADIVQDLNERGALENQSPLTDDEVDSGPSPFTEAIATLGLPDTTADSLASQGIDDIKTLLMYSAPELVKECEIKGGHARKLLEYFKIQKTSAE